MLSCTSNKWNKKSRIRTISEGSCDTEDWCNDIEYVCLNYTLKYITKNVISDMQNGTYNIVWNIALIEH